MEPRSRLVRVIGSHIISFQPVACAIVADWARSPNRETPPRRLAGRLGPHFPKTAGQPRTQLELGDVEGFRRRRTQELRQFAAAQGVAAHRVAKDCLMIPTEGEELRLAAELADRALSAAPQDAWSFQTKGMAEYRFGHYEQAIAWLSKAADGKDRWRDPECELFLAMACGKTGQPEKARAALERAVHLMDTSLPRPGEGDMGQMAQDWVLCQLVHREAEALISGKPPSTQLIATTQPTASTRPTAE